MASIIFLNIRLQYPAKGVDGVMDAWNAVNGNMRHYVDFNGDNPKAIITKGNIIEGIEAKE